MMNKEHVLMIGASKGSGRISAQTLAQAGYQVSVISRRPPQEKIDGARHWSADITKPALFAETLEAIVRQAGPLHHLIFCHQFRGEGDAWAGQIETSLTAVKRVIESAVDHFAPARGGSTIVIVSSICGRLIAVEQPVGYHVAKAGLEQMVRYYAMALGRKGIRVNAVAPNSVLKAENRDFYKRNKELYDLYAKILPLGRMVSSEDVAGAIAFLCGPPSSGITGQTLVIDGGMSLQDHEGMARSLMSLDQIQLTKKNHKPVHAAADEK